MTKIKSGPKRVVITGASSGIGAATAESFAERGAKLVLAARNGGALDVVAARCRTRGADVITVPTDVTDAAAVVALAERASTWLGGIDLWFSNVGIGVVGRFHEVPVALHRQVIEANLIGHLNDAHAVLPIFRAQGRGIFVNMISSGGYVAVPWAVAYSASKFGLRGMSEALRAELSGFPDIHICDVYPTFVDTPAIRHAGNHSGGRLSVPPGVLDPRSVADVVVSLADRPRNSSAIGAPAAVMKLVGFLTPNRTPWAMNGFMERYFAKAERVPETEGNLFVPPADDGQIDGGFRNQRPARVTGKAKLVGAGIAVGVAGLLLARRARSTSQNRESDRDATYPPLDRVKPVGENLWVVDSGPIRAMGMKMPVRMTIIRLANGDLMLHSPTQFTPALAAEIAKLGPIRHLVAPNIAHWTFIADWQRALPGATVWGVPGLRDRAQVRKAGLRIDAELQAEASSPWAAEIVQGMVTGAGGFCEAWFYHRASGTLLLVDLIENLEADRLPPVTGLLMKASAATRGTTALHVRAAVLGGGDAAKESVRAMVATAPERAIFAHGEMFDREADVRLRQAFAWLL